MDTTSQDEFPGAGEITPRARIRGRGLGSPRNGLPEPKRYVYRGTGEDIMPAAVMPDPGEPVVMPRERSGGGRRMQYGRTQCGACGWDRRSKRHQALCAP